MSRGQALGNWGRLLALVAMWGSAFLLTKVAVTAIDPALVVAGRLAVACLVLLPLVALSVRPRAAGCAQPSGSPGGALGAPPGPWTARLWIFLALIALVGNVLPFSLISWGQQAIDSGLAGILMAVMPLFTLGLAHFFVPGERLNPYRVGGFLLGFAGVTVLMGPESLLAAGIGEGSLLPMLAVLAGAVCYSVSAILARLRPPSEAVASAAATTAMAAAVMVPAALAAGLPGALATGLLETSVPAAQAGAGQAAVLAGLPAGLAAALAADPAVGWPRTPDLGPLLAVAGLGVFSTAWASVVYLDLVKRASPAFVAQLNYLIPLWALLGGILFLGERPEPRHLYALGLILGGILLAQLERRRGLKAG